MRSMLAAAALCVVACGEAPGPPEPVATDSAGVVVVVSPAPLWDEGRGWEVGPPILTVGGGPSDDLYGIVGLARISDGGVVLVEEGGKTVRWYGPDGSARGMAGGDGDGPGELRLPQAIGVARGDSVWVYDYALARITWYAPDRSVAGVIGLAPPLPSALVVGRLAEGTFALASQFGGGGGPLRTGLVRDTVPYAIYGADGVLLDTLGRFPGRESMHRPEGRRMVMSAVPFAHGSSHAVHGGELAIGDQVNHELRTFTPAGALLRVVRWAGEALELTDRQVGDWIEAQVAMAPSAERPGLRAQLAETPRPDTRPAYGAFLSDPTGALWVAEYTHRGLAPSAWHVFDPEGRWLGPVTMPPSFRPLAVGEDWIAGVARDGLDVERVEVRPLLRSRR